MRGREIIDVTAGRTGDFVRCHPAVSDDCFPGALAATRRCRKSRGGALSITAGLVLQAAPGKQQAAMAEADQRRGREGDEENGRHEDGRREAEVHLLNGKGDKFRSMWTQLKVLPLSSLAYHFQQDCCEAQTL